MVLPSRDYEIFDIGFGATLPSVLSGFSWIRLPSMAKISSLFWLLKTH